MIPKADAFSVTVSVVVKPEDLKFKIEPRYVAESGATFSFTSRMLKTVFGRAVPTEGALTKLFVKEAIERVGVGPQDKGSILLAQTILHGQRPAELTHGLLGLQDSKFLGAPRAADSRRSVCFFRDPT